MKGLKPSRGICVAPCTYADDYVAPQYLSLISKEKLYYNKMHAKNRPILWTLFMKNIW